jgi:putative transposase
MAKASTPTFVLELPLVVIKGDERIILARLEAGRRLYNATLHEALTRLSTMRSSLEWQSAQEQPKGKARNDAFKAANEQYGFSEYALHDFVKPVRLNAGWKDRLSAQEAQKIASRVFKAVSEYAFGARGKPRFKGINRPLHSLEGKQNTTGIRFRKELGIVEWSGLILPVIAKDTDYINQALQNKTKYCRIVWKNLNGQKRFYVQLMQEGKAPNRELFVADGVEVGLDIGPSTIAVVSEQAVGLETFAPSVVQPWAEVKRLQRKLDHSRRATNPTNYNANGTIKKGVKLVWKQSSRYQQHKTKLATTERKLTAARKRDHGELVNKILAQGNVIKTETISHKGFQKNFGRSAKVKASGLFFSHLTRKAESAGGKVIELNTRELAMSQYDHVSDARTKKPLSQRHHNLGDGVCCVQRDMYSAFLALNASEDTHNPHQLKQSWSAVEPLLRRTGLCVDQSANGKASRFSTVLLPSERIVRHSIFGTGQGVRFSRN